MKRGPQLIIHQMTMFFQTAVPDLLPNKLLTVVYDMIWHGIKERERNVVSPLIWRINQMLLQTQFFTVAAMLLTVVVGAHSVAFRANVSIAIIQPRTNVATTSTDY